MIVHSTVVIISIKIKRGFFNEKKNQFILDYTQNKITIALLLTVLAKTKISTRKKLCKANSCFILIIISLEDM